MNAFTFETQVNHEGRIVLEVPLPPGTRIFIFAVATGERDQDLLNAAEGSLDFWDNPLDDEDWNRVKAWIALQYPHTPTQGFRNSFS